LSLLMKLNYRKGMKMSVMTEIHLDTFKPRDYQLPACDAFENQGYKKMLLVWGRRSGKDIVCWNLMVRQAIRKVGVYMYALPTFSQGRKVIWDSITNDGMRFIDFIPPQLIKSSNSQELKITLFNGSIIQIIGSDSYDTSLVGTNPRMVVFSEFALADSDAFKFVMPILNGNGGSLIIVSTPRGKNEFWNLYNIAQNSSEWFCQKLSLSDTNHIPLDLIKQDIEEGLVSPDLVQQEYYCSFDQGAEGSYYAKYIDKLRISRQIGKVPWEPQFRVSTAWDLGVRDSTCIIFFQVIGQVVHVIDCYSKNKEGLEHYINIVNNKPYQYDKHWAPHDIAVKEFGSGLTRLEKAKQLGIKFESRDSGKSSALPQLSIEDGIEAVRSALPKMWFDEERCKPLVKSLENYRQEFDERRKVYRDRPLHDLNSHYADAFRYLVLSLSRIRDGNSTPEELEKRYRQAQGYGGDGLGIGQGFFNDNHRIY
jgi:phage terminase large subunit